MHGRHPGGRLARAISWFAVKLRWPILIGWIAAAVAAWMFLPALGTTGSSPLGDIVPENAKALQTEQRAFQIFGSSVATDTVVVQRNPRGLQRPEAEAHLLGARAVADKRVPPELGGVRAAVPLINAPAENVPWRERNTTALTYLFFGEDMNLVERDRAVEDYERAYLRPASGSTIGATGAGPARLTQFEVIEDRLPLVEGATVAVIVGIVALYFRSLGAPLVALVVAALAYVLAVRLLAWSGERLGAAVPQEIEPILVVLLLGLVTDYTVFFLSEGRRRLMRGEARLEAARRASVRIVPIVFTAGVIVAAGSASLLAGRLEFFRVFGPGLAVCALVVTIVCVTLLPAVLAIAGPWLFGKRVRNAEPPKRSGRDPGAVLAATPSSAIADRTRGAAVLRPLRRAEGGPAPRPGGGQLPARRGGRAHPRRPPDLRAPGPRMHRGAPAGRLPGARHRPVGVLRRRLPPDSEPREAGDQAASGFVPGILAPTDVVLEGPGVARRLTELQRLQGELAKRPGVAAVLGPQEAAATTRTSRFALAPDGNAARVVVVLGDDPGAPPPSAPSTRSIATFRA
jgi:RND superfamily putative drug exporter